MRFSSSSLARAFRRSAMKDTRPRIEFWLPLEPPRLNRPLPDDDMVSVCLCRLRVYDGVENWSVLQERRGLGLKVPSPGERQGTASWVSWLSGESKEGFARINSRPRIRRTCQVVATPMKEVGEVTTTADNLPSTCCPRRLPRHQHAKPLPFFTRLTSTHPLPAFTESSVSRDLNAENCFDYRLDLILYSKLALGRKTNCLKQVNTVVVSSTMALQVHAPCNPMLAMPCLPFCKGKRRLCPSASSSQAHLCAFVFGRHASEEML
jgi:hypothetical protein